MELPILEEQIVELPQPERLWPPDSHPFAGQEGCRIVALIMEIPAQEYDGKSKLSKLNMGDNRDIQNQFGVTSTPMLIIFKNGKPVERIVGAARIDHYRKKIEKFI